jgi:hypothetical protein
MVDAEMDFYDRTKKDHVDCRAQANVGDASMKKQVKVVESDEIDLRKVELELLNKGRLKIVYTLGSVYEAAVVYEDLVEMLNRGEIVWLRLHKPV